MSRKPRIQPIIGCTLSLSFATEGEPTPPGVEIRRPAADGRIALLAKDAEGYANLMRLSSNAYLAAVETGEVVTSIRQLAAQAQGLIALTGGPEGVIDLALAEANPDLARVRLATLKGIFGDRLYVEVQRHGLPQERAVEPVLLELAYDTHLPIVATNEPYFAAPRRFRSA